MALMRTSPSKNRERWVHMALQGFLLAAYCGPPCESWSCARYQELTGCSVRPIRSAQALWEFSSLRLREVSQIVVGNILLQFSMLIYLAQAVSNRFAMIEHPAEPAQRHMASVWRTGLGKLAMGHPRSTFVTEKQGWHGARSAKPTGLLTTYKGARDIFVARRSANCAQGTSIGFENIKGKKRFQTSQLKEYPAEFARSMVACLEAWIRAEAPDLSCTAATPQAVIESLRSFEQALDCSVQNFGPDFAGAARVS